jgi:hypothetical protein
MDPFARAFYELLFRVAFMEKKGEAFQDLFSSSMEKRYPGDFVRVRPWGSAGDRKNDGYLKSKRTLFQCYAPNDLTAADCIAKIDEDFFGALPYWEKHFDIWIFVHNSRAGLGPQVTERLLELGNTQAPVKLSHWGFEELRLEVMQLPEEALASLLGPAPSREGMINLGLADLAPVLDQVGRLTATSDPDLRPVPPDKLQRNMLSDAVAVLLKAGMTRADLVRRYFTNQPLLQDQLAESFRAQYVQLRRKNIAPDEIFSALQRFAGGNVIPTPTVQNAVLAVLAFFFEECDVFERPDETTP